MALENQELEKKVLKAVSDETRPYLSSLLDSFETRSQAFVKPLSESLSGVDLLLFAIQISSGLEFLANVGVSTQGW